MHKWIKLFMAFLLVVVALSIVSFVFSVAVNLVIFAIKTFVFFSIIFFAYMWMQSIFKKKDKSA